MKEQKNILAARILKQENRNLLLENKFNVLEHNFLTFNYLENTELLNEIKTTKNPIVCTSKRALNSIVQMLQNHNVDFKGYPIFCTSEVAKKIALQNGFNVIESAENSGDLANKIVKYQAEQVLFCTTEKRLKTLEKVLMEAEINCSIFLVYEKKFNSKTIENYDAILFFSPSQIESFLIKNKLNAQIPICCIGKTTATFAAKQGFENIIIAAKTSEQQMTKALIKHFKE